MSRFANITSLAAPLALTGILAALPVANNDSFTTDEDETLSIASGGVILSAAFGDSGAAIGGTWDYLDRIQNENGTNQDYPVDGSGRPWNSTLFEPETSTIGPWNTAAAPLQGGRVDGFPPGTPAVLAGIGSAGNGENLVTTYLFRHEFTLDAATATVGDWQLDYLLDDGAVIHLNGVEVARTPNMPAGPVTTTTLSGLGDETNTTSLPLDLTGILSEGANVLAVEVHQESVTSSDAGLLLTLTPVSGTPSGGFTYADDTFNGTSQPGFATGDIDATGGADGAGLFVQVGGNPGGNRSSSGGWSRSFTLDAPATATVSFHYRLVFNSGHESDEFAEALFEVDGTRYGNDTGNSLARFTGDGNGGVDDDTGWQLASFDVPLGAGEHTIVLGAYSNKSTIGSEITRAWFDDAAVSIPATGEGVLANDSGDAPTAVLDEGPEHGILTLRPDGSFTYRPDPDYSGRDTFTYHASDPTGDSNIATVSVTVRSVNDPPVAMPESFAGSEDQPVSRPAPGVLANDSDVDNTILGALLEDDVINGALDLRPDGSFLYTPRPGFFGSDSFTYRASDGPASSDPVTVSFDIAPINDPPEALDDDYTTVENTPVSITSADGLEEVVFFSDFNGATLPPGLSGAGDLEGVQGYDGIGRAGNTFSGNFLRNSSSGNPALPTTLTLENLPPHQSISLGFLLAVIDSWDGNNDNLVITVDGVEVFNHNFRNRSGNQSFPYPAGSLLVRDQELAFTANTNAFREAGYDMRREPALRDIPHTASTATISWFASGSNWSGGNDESWAIDNLEVSVSAAPVEALVPAGANWSFLDDGSDQDTAWRNPGYDDSAWAVGPAELGYGDGDEATVVGFGDDPGDRHITTYFRHSFEVTDAGGLGDLVAGFIRDDGGAVYLNGTRIATDNLDIDAGYAAPANTNPGLTTESTWSEFEVPAELLVEGTNLFAVEVHQDDPGSADLSMDAYLRGKRVTNGGVLTNDTDPEDDPLSVELVDGPDNGTLVINEDGTFLYTPRVNYEGPDSFTYRVSDGEFQSATATVSLTMTSSPNDLPVTTPDSFAATEDTLLTVPAGTGVLENDSDPDSPSLTVALDTPPTHGNLALTAGGGFTYTPDLNYSGIDTFTYLASDGIAFSPPETATITIAPVNDRPAALADAYLADPGQTFLASAASGVLANDSDPDSPALTAVLVSETTSGDLDLAADGSFSYEPDEGFMGTDSFTYEASDGLLNSPATTVTIRVNQAPLANDDFYSTLEDNPMIRPAAEGLLFNDDDADPITAILVSEPQHGTLRLGVDGSFIYVPDGDFHGTDSFTYRASDSLRPSNLATVELTVSPVNDSPRGRDDSYETVAEQLLAVNETGGVLGNDSDVDSPVITAVLTGDVTDGELSLSSDGSFTYQPDPGFTGSDSFTYQADDGPDSSGDTLVTIEVLPESSNIVINEIMFNPSSGNDREEFIELTNIGTTTVSLNGWMFTKGVDFTFPDVSIPAGGFLVVAADTVSFEAAYGTLPAVIGNWDGRLSNSGERVRLVDGAGKQVDQVKYHDQGDWATRTRITDSGEQGWSWSSAADAQGSSLELVLPGLGNKQGQNWAASLNNTPTPSAPNSTAQTDVAPLILDVEHVPPIPGPGDPVGIVAELRDTLGEQATATLHYRVSAQNPGPFLSAPMLDDGQNRDSEPGDGVFGHVLAPMPEGTVIEFYIESGDGTNTRTWPAPASNGQTANALLQVDDEANSFDHGFYRIILPVPEYNQWQGINRQSNAMMNATLVLDDGSVPKIRYLAGMRVRGAGSRNHTPPSMRVALPRDDGWNDSSRMNLNTRFTYLQFIGMKLFQASGMPAPDTYRVQVRINGNNIARNDEFDHGSMVHVQPLSGEFIDDKLASDSDGNLYKKVRPAREFRWRNGDGGAYEADGWSKQTNSSENDWSDLDNMLYVINNLDPRDRNLLEQVESVADFDQWMNWFAAMTILANGETNISNGADDDFSMYSGALDPRFIFIPHDLDTILSIGDGSRITDPHHTLFDMIERGDVLDPLIPLFTDREIIDRYYRALRELLETAFSEQEFNELLENNVGGWVPAASIEQMRDFMNARRLFIESEITPVIGPPGTRPPATSSGTVTAAHGPLYLSEVLAINDRTRSIDGTRPDAIELHNSGPVALPLGGMSLSDDPLLPNRFVFPPGTTIPAGGYLVVWGGSPLPTPGLYTGFSLDGEGETLSLYDTPATGGALLDRITFGLQLPDHSIGRTGRGATTWRLCQPTLGTANLGLDYGDPSLLRINEWLTQHDERIEEDFVEIHNPASDPVALGSLAISDEPVDDPARHRMAPLSFIAPGGFSLLFPLGDSANPARADELPFRLSSDNEWIALRGENDVLIDQVHFVNQRADISRGRDPDGSSLYRDLPLPTPGASNSASFANEQLMLQNLRISEIMYNPSGGSDLEFIELQNLGDDPINLAGLRFTEGIRFEFPNMILQPHSFVLVVGDRVAFEARYGTGLDIAGQYDGKLDNDGERLRLQIAGLDVGIHDFAYDDWYPAANGAGSSLEFIDTSLGIAAWGVEQNWAASLAVNGTPGEGGEFSVHALAAGLISLPAELAITTDVSYGALSPAGAAFQWLLVDGPAPVVFSTPQQPGTTVAFSQPGIYTLRLDASATASQANDTIEVAVYDSYPAWVLRNFGAEIPLVTGKNDDPDSDGIINLVEFAVLMDPLLPDSELAPKPVLDPGDDALGVTYPLNFVDPASLAVIPEVSEDLQRWSSSPAAVTRQVLSDTHGFQIIRALDTTRASDGGRHFMRLRVSCPDGSGTISGFRILGITGAPQAPVITFTSEPGQRYQLESSTDPAAGWTPVGQPVTAVSPTTILSDPTPATGPVRLYRIRLLP